MQAKSAQNRSLHRIFTTLPQRYDLINHIMTLGMDRRWRLNAARECLTSEPKKILDLCCGTGDLLINLAKLTDNSVELTATDYSLPMLELAAGKAKRLAAGKKIQFVHGDVSYLPFPDNCFDCIGISFAFRNLTYQNPLASRHLAEILRVLKKGGRLIIVETSQPRMKLIQKLYHLYLRCFAFVVGFVLSGNRGAYYYLAESASRFYTAGELKKILIAAGFRQVLFHPLLFGGIAIHVAVK